MIFEKIDIRVLMQYTKHLELKTQLFISYGVLLLSGGVFDMALYLTSLPYNNWEWNFLDDFLGIQMAIFMIILNLLLHKFGHAEDEHIQSSVKNHWDLGGFLCILALLAVIVRIFFFLFFYL